MNHDQRLQAAAWSFAGAAVFGSVVSLRYDVSGEPLGIRAPFSTLTGVLLGWGAGVAAPWPMPLTAVVAASARGFTQRGLVCAALGGACIAGSIVEPVTLRRRRWTPAIAIAIGANLASSVAMLIVGLRHRGAG